MNIRELRDAVDKGGMTDRAAMAAAAEIFRENAAWLRQIAGGVEAAADDLVGPGIGLEGWTDIAQRLMGAQLQATLALRGLAGGEQAIGAALDVLLVLLQREGAF